MNRIWPSATGASKKTSFANKSTIAIGISREVLVRRKMKRGHVSPKTKKPEPSNSSVRLKNSKKPKPKRKSKRRLQQRLLRRSRIGIPSSCSHWMI